MLVAEHRRPRAKQPLDVVNVPAGPSGDGVGTGGFGGQQPKDGLGQALLTFVQGHEAADQRTGDLVEGRGHARTVNPPVHWKVER